MTKVGGIGFLVSLIFGSYLIVGALGLATIPAFLVSLDKWVFLISAFFLIIGGLYYFYKSSKNSMSASSNNLGVFGLIVYSVLGFYFVNLFFNFIPAITNVLSGFARWINLIAGILIILGGIYFWKQERY